MDASKFISAFVPVRISSTRSEFVCCISSSVFPGDRLCTAPRIASSRTNHQWSAARGHQSARPFSAYAFYVPRPHRMKNAGGRNRLFPGNQRIPTTHSKDEHRTHQYSRYRHHNPCGFSPFSFCFRGYSLRRLLSKGTWFSLSPADFKTNPARYPDRWLPAHAADIPAWSYNEAKIQESGRCPIPCPRF